MSDFLFFLREVAVFGRGLPREEDDAVRGRGRRAKSGAWGS